MLPSSFKHRLSIIAAFAMLLTLALPFAAQAQSNPSGKLSPGSGTPPPSVTATSSPSVKVSPGSNPPSSNTASNMTISSTSGWQTTTLTVTQGKLFSIAYISGTWTVDVNNYSSVDPDGYPPNIDQQIYQGCKYDSSLPYATLLGEIGSGPDFKIGTGGAFKASASGTVSLRINDQDGCLADNSGSIAVMWIPLLPSLRLPWDRTLTNIPLTSGPHSNAHPGQPCVNDPISSLSGLDFGLAMNTDVLAVASGKVVFAGDSGNTDIRGEVIIDHGHGFITEYWHLNAETVTTGQQVTQGTLVGKSGWSPCSSCPNGQSIHLHLEFRQYTTNPSASTPYPAQGMLIDGYQAWTEAIGSAGTGLNYEGTMTRGATQTQLYTDPSCNQQATQWTAPAGITIYAEASRTGGDLVSSNAEIRLTGKTGKFFYNNNNSGVFDITPSTTPVFTQSFGALFFNPPASSTSNDATDSLRVYRQTCIQSSGVDENSRPFRAVTPNADGSCTVTIVHGNGQKAGVRNMSSFEAVFTTQLIVPYAGVVTFHIYSDDGWILAIGPSNGNQPTYVSGPMNNAPATGPFTGYPVVGANNTMSSPTSFTLTVNVPAAGTYPVELDYTECCQGTLTLVFVPGYN